MADWKRVAAQAVWKVEGGDAFPLSVVGCIERIRFASEKVFVRQL